ncbi:biotin transporter BioY [Actinomycetaceae bacterium WB03_NA08]|uniref:Biotin transporter n=1 Tax=Scrofimicrobium canadense TaxID=2652290 RepID=A0A6N7W7G8_9ACTO|nr:biotin transporter BioY [Scrofimicrobium canadense]MSS85195.1 biotin transporter BioY [Scrofimicrobium canadense]
MTTVALARTKTVFQSIPAQMLSGVLALTLLSQVVIPLPFSPVPLTLSTLAAMLLGVYLGPIRGMAAAVLYAAAAAVGAPILAGFTAGVMVVSFGYVIGYIVAAGIVGVYASRLGKANPLIAFFVAGAASLSVYIPGVIWMMLATGMDLRTGIAAGVVPFLIGDALKSIVVAGALTMVRR